MISKYQEDNETKIYRILLRLLKKIQKRGNVPVAAIVTNFNGKIIAIGTNKTSRNLVTNHAEIYALNKACRKLKFNKLNNYQIWVTMEPCMMCLGAIINSGIKKINYFIENKKYGFLKSNHTFDLSKMSIYKVKNKEYNEVIKNIITTFFQNLR